MPLPLVGQRARSFTDMATFGQPRLHLLTRPLLVDMRLGPRSLAALFVAQRRAGSGGIGADDASALGTSSRSCSLSELSPVTLAYQGWFHPGKPLLSDQQLLHCGNESHC